MDTNNNHEISLQEAIDLTKRFRAGVPAGMPLSETFESSVIADLLATEGCAFLRIYYGTDDAGDVHAILVTANDKNEDILPAGNNTAASGTDPVIIEDGIRCPPACPPKSPLNGG